MNNDLFHIVLVEPRGPINIGSVCRAMKNFGFTKLRLVNPTKHYKSLDARKMALTAFHIIEDAPVFETLESALHDIQAAFGTTRRFGKYRRNFLTPSNAAEKINGSYGEIKSALVMGPEDNGLETKDLDHCQHFITIPTHDGYPSMNLSHSVSVLLYEISLKSDDGKKFYDPAPGNLATGKELEGMFAHMKKSMLDIEFLDPQNPDHLLRTFRQAFSNLSSRDVRIIRGLMSRIDWIEQQRRKKNS